MTVRADDGAILAIPPGWGFLAPGDAGVTRRVKALGPSWTVEVERGRKRFSQGLWAPQANIAKAQASMASTRADPDYERRLAAGRARREREQEAYVLDFTRHVEAFLAFHARHAATARELAVRIAEHATPVGSGTVARTERIPVAERAEAAVIAWLRHQTTAYDRMAIPREKGARREVRRMLAQRSRELLARYRRGEAPDPDCPLAVALARPRPARADADDAPAPAGRLLAGIRPAVRPAAPRGEAAEGASEDPSARPAELMNTGGAVRTAASRARSAVRHGAVAPAQGRAAASPGPAPSPTNAAPPAASAAAPGPAPSPAPVAPPPRAPSPRPSAPLPATPEGTPRPATRAPALAPQDERAARQQAVRARMARRPGPSS